MTILNRGKRLGCALAVIAAVLGFGLAGCGDDDDGQGSQLFRILVTNDDGIGAEGIDALVEALRADPDNDVVVVAPNGNRSGVGDMTGPSPRCGDLSVAPATTISGYAATAVDGCPADCVNYALADLYPVDTPPHLVVSGINEGQNVSAPVATGLSGTVGAALTAARRGVPAVAVSQGRPVAGGEYDYPAAADAVLSWLEDRRGELLDGGAPVEVDNINVPSCHDGTIRGTLAGIPLAPTMDGFFDTQDCTSTLSDPSDDVEALNNGFIAQSTVPLDEP